MFSIVLWLASNRPIALLFFFLEGSFSIIAIFATIEENPNEKNLAGIPNIQLGPNWRFSAARSAAYSVASLKQEQMIDIHDTRRRSCPARTGVEMPGTGTGLRKAGLDQPTRPPDIWYKPGISMF